MDIKEIAKKMTRKEFLNTYGGYCPSKFELENSENCEDEKWSCYNCLKEAAKDIKFKGDIEKTQGEKIKNEFANWINENWEEDPNGFKFLDRISKIVEGEKMEDKTIKVRCINTLNFKDLTLDKEYPVIEEEPQGYKIINDDESIRRHHKSLFKKVEDTLMVECINNMCRNSQLKLTIGEKYKVQKEFDESYEIKNDTGNICGYGKEFFKLVESQKETKSYIIDDNWKEVRVDKGEIIKEYSAIELLDFPVGTQFKDKDGCLVEIQKIEDTENEKKIVFSGSFEEGGLEISTIWERMKFTKVEQAITNHIKAFNELKGKKPINYEEEYKKYKKLADNLKGDIDKYINGYDEIRKENDKLKEVFNKKQNQWENEQVERIEELESILKDRNNYIHDLQISHNTIEKENSKLRELVKTLASML